MFLPLEKSVRLIGFQISNFSDDQAIQTELFEF